MDFIQAVLPYGIPCLAAIIGYLIARYLKIAVETANISKVISVIISAIWDVEIETHDKKKPAQYDYNLYREDMAKDIIDKSLSPKQKTWLSKAFGGLTGAVKSVFPVIKPELDRFFKDKARDVLKKM